MPKKKRSNKSSKDSSGDLVAEQQQATNPGAMAGQAVAISRTEFNSGPLPVPSLLEEYDRIVPGGAERIFALAEEQTRHRLEME